MTKKPALLPLHQATQDFFENYLTIERNASRNTISAYWDAFRLFLQHAPEKHGVEKHGVEKYGVEKYGVEIDRLDDSALELDTVRSFLDWLQRVRASSPRSRNQRLAALKSFARYLASVSPEHLDRCRLTREMPQASFERPEVEYLEVDEIARLLEATDGDRLNRALLLLLHSTGATRRRPAGLAGRQHQPRTVLEGSDLPPQDKTPDHPSLPSIRCPRQRHCAPQVFSAEIDGSMAKTLSNQ